VWSGTQLVVWGGQGENAWFANGGRYSPGGSWTALPATPAAFSEPSERFNAVSVWTGSEWLVWGGQTSDNQFLRSGGRFKPLTSTWTNMALAGSPSPRANATAVWTGTEMIVWGGNEFFSQQGTGARYHAGSNAWFPVSTVNAPRARSGHVAAWTGKEMIVWGGYYYTNFLDTVFLNDGARYNPETDTWTRMTNHGFTFPAAFATATWTGKELLVAGGLSEAGPNLYYVNTIYSYNPTNDGWSLAALLPNEHRRYGHTAVWTGTELLVWGGRTTNVLDTGFRYNPATDIWADLPDTAASGRTGHSAVWTGQHMIIHGGESSFLLPDTALFDPVANRWTTAGVLFGRANHTAVWTGTEMLIGTGRGGADLKSTYALRPGKTLHYYQKQ
jgi:N-acetylneuraminic acid mutarotase